MLFTKLEKPLFFRCAFIGLNGSPSPDIRFGLMVPLSDRGGVVSAAPFPLPSPLDNRNSLKRKSGDVLVCVGCAGLDSEFAEVNWVAESSIVVGEEGNSTDSG